MMMRTAALLLILFHLLALTADTGLASWPANHINSLSDIRCRQWCTFRFREGSRTVFVGRDAEIRRFLVDDYVKRTQDQGKTHLGAEMRDNKRQFMLYYSRLSDTGSRHRNDRTVRWFNLYHDYLHCLRECFDT